MPRSHSHHRRGTICHVPIDPARFWTKLSAVEERPLGRWPHPDGRALLHDPNLRRPTQAARVAWQPSHEPVPDGLQVLHLCDHPWCVRPTHLVLSSLVLSSQATNMPIGCAAQVRARHRRLTAAGQQLVRF